MKKLQKLVSAVLSCALALSLAAAPALAAEGETRVADIAHIDRGYEDLVRDLRALGADVRREDADPAETRDGGK